MVPGEAAARDEDDKRCDEGPERGGVTEKNVMQKHTRIYMKHFGHGEQSLILCELHEHGCEGRAVDIHHIEGRGKDKDVIDNLVALCRPCHSLCHSGNVSKEKLRRAVHIRNGGYYNEVYPEAKRGDQG